MGRDGFYAVERNGIRNIHTAQRMDKRRPLLDQSENVRNQRKNQRRKQVG